MFLQPVDIPSQEDSTKGEENSFHTHLPCQYVLKNPFFSHPRIHVCLWKAEIKKTEKKSFLLARMFEGIKFFLLDRIYRILALTSDTSSGSETRRIPFELEKR